jgi:hypothetical protein
MSLASGQRAGPEGMLVISITDPTLWSNKSESIRRRFAFLLPYKLSNESDMKLTYRCYENDIALAATGQHLC